MTPENQTDLHPNPERPSAAAAGLRVQIAKQPGDIDAAAWDALLAQQATPTPFMRHACLAALHDSGSAVPDTGWNPQFLLLHDAQGLAAACPLYLKTHSWGEYVFDWAWARAYAEHGLDYYPKAVVAVPFTPVPGSRLLARDAQARRQLVDTLVELCRDNGLSSLHILYGDAIDQQTCEQAGLMLRQQVQFHWKNRLSPRSPAAPGALPPEGALAALGRPGGGSGLPPRSPAAPGALPSEGMHDALERPFVDFEDFLRALSQDKRKKIRQERRKVAASGVDIRWRQGRDIPAADWDFFWRCYERTYLEHGNPPYLNRDFFRRMAEELPEHWLMFIAEQGGQAIAASLIGLSRPPGPASGPLVAYGRYWGALQRVHSLHFELCYYAPLAWCIAHGADRFEGGAQGEHKMARALLPSPTASAHWLAHPGFADAVERYLQHEDRHTTAYLQHLENRSPFRHG